MALDLEQRVDALEAKWGRLATKKDLEATRDALEDDIKGLDTRLGHVERAIVVGIEILNGMAERFTFVEDRLANVEDRLVNVEDRLVDVEDRLANIETIVRDTSGRLSNLEEIVLDTNQYLKRRTNGLTDGDEDTEGPGD